PAVSRGKSTSRAYGGTPLPPRPPPPLHPDRRRPRERVQPQERLPRDTRSAPPEPAHRPPIGDRRQARQRSHGPRGQLDLAAGRCGDGMESTPVSTRWALDDPATA